MQHPVFNIMNGTILNNDISFKDCVCAYMWDVKSINTMVRSDALWITVLLWVSFYLGKDMFAVPVAGCINV